MNPTNLSNDNIQELENLRFEVAQFKKRLDEQNVLTERYIMKAVKGKMSHLKRSVYRLSAIALMAIPLWIWLKFQVHYSWAFTIGTILMLLWSLGISLYISRINIEKMDMNLTETALRLQKMKKQRAFYEMIGCFVIIPLWLIWLVFEYYRLYYSQDPYIFIGMLIMPMFGVIVGYIVGLYLYKKMQHDVSEMIEDIEQLQRQTD